MEGSVFTVRQFDHVNLHVRDVERAIRFYTEVLGLPLVRRDVNAAGQITFAAVKAGPQLIDLMPRPDYRPPDEPEPRSEGVNHIALVIEATDPQALIAYLRERGAEVYRGPVQVKGAYGMGTAIYFYDPDRHAIELKQYPPGATEVS
jgi:lactoylglutathione lyase